MTTPNFIAQDSSTLTAVRYYTEYDPYYLDVDNRPLTDIASNVTAVATGSADAGRRAAAITQLALNSLMTNVTTAGYFTGLVVTNPSPNVISVGPGNLFIRDVINTVNSTSVVKQAMMLSTFTSGTLGSGLTTGQSINYLVQAKFNYLDSSGMTTSVIPFIDATNAYLPGALQVGELVVAIKAGTAASTGSQTTPTADSGYLPLYVVTSTYGSTAPTVALASGAPLTNKMVHTATFTRPGSGAASTATVNSRSLQLFQESGTQSILLDVPLKKDNINPYAPITLTLSMSSSAANNNAAFQITYLALGDGDSTGAAATTTDKEQFPMASTTNTVATKTTTTLVIPASAFAGYVSNTWTVLKRRLLVTLTRVPADALDTQTGDITLLEAVISQ